MRSYKDELRASKRKKLILKSAIFFAVLIIGLVGAVYLLFFARLMDVREVTVEAEEEMRGRINNEISSWLNSGFWRFTEGSNLLFLSGNVLASRIIEKFPELESVKITKKFSHALIATVQERKPSGIWCLSAQAGLSEQADCFYFDKSGKAFSSTQPSNGFLVLNVIDQRSRELGLGDKVAEEVWTKNIFKAKDVLSKHNISIAMFVIPPDSFDEFHAKTAEGWKILFGNQTDIESQISALAIFLKEKISPAHRATLQYVDLRIQDRIYYK